VLGAALQSIRGRSAYIQASLFYLLERIVGITLSFVVYIALARNYGPTILGGYSFVQTVMLFAVPFLASGSEGIIVRELVRKHRPEPEIMGSSFVVLSLTGLVTTLLPLLGLLVFHGDERSLVLMAMFTAVGLVPSGFLVAEHWFKSQHRAAEVLTARASSAVIGAALKLYLILSHHAVELVVLATAIESFLLTAVLLYFYQRHRKVRAWTLDLDYAKVVFRQSFPGMIASVAVMIFFRINHMLLVYLVGYEPVGQYAAAFQTAQIFLVLPTVFFSAIYPKLVHLHHHDPARYRIVLNAAYWAFSLAGYSIFAVCFFLAHPIFMLVFGPRYEVASEVVVVLALANVVNFSGAVRGRVIDIANTTHYHVWSALLGLVVVLPLSWVVIPRYGALGAAWSIAVAAFVAGVASTAFLPAVRDDAVVQLKALLLIPSFRLRDLF
jgi:O-antigen/teichoic acid export membrane protein